MRTINKDFIGVIKEEENGLLKYEEIDIPYPKELIEGIEAICQRDDTTIMDIQELYWKYFPKEEEQEKIINYLYPYEYISIYKTYSSNPKFYNAREYPFKKMVCFGLDHMVGIPQYRVFPCGFTSKAEYEKALYIKSFGSAIKESMIVVNQSHQRIRNIKNKQKLEVLKKFSDEQKVEIICTFEKRQDYPHEFKEFLEKAIEKKKELTLNWRDYFAEGISRYIYAKYYDFEKEQISESVLMLSTDTRGWTKYEYNIAADERIEIRSNYGFGSKSYHYCNLYYKDIPVLPYTDVLYYYSIQWSEVIKYTRSYEPVRETCWKQTFQFAEYISNLIKRDTKRFINEYLVGEIKTMIEKLEEYVKNPSLCSEDSLRYKDDESRKLYTYFNNIETDEISELFKVSTHAQKIRECLFDMNDSEKSNLENDIQEIERYDDKLEEIIFVKNCGMSKTEYAILPEEKDITITFEKITGCLSFIDNLRQLANHLSEIQQYIDRLIKLNEKVFENISKQKENLSKEIQKDSDTIQKFESILTELRAKGSEIEENNYKEYSLYQRRKKLMEENEYYKELTSLIGCLEVKNKQMKDIFKLRNNLLMRYEGYENRIKKFISFPQSSSISGEVL